MKETKPNSKVRKFVLKWDIPLLKHALMAQLWEEKKIEPINDRELDMKFVYWKKDRDFTHVKPTCWINHN